MWVEKHRDHIQKLETLLRMLDNTQVKLQGYIFPWPLPPLPPFSSQGKSFLGVLYRQIVGENEVLDKQFI